MESEKKEESILEGVRNRIKGKERDMEEKKRKRA